MICNGCYKMSDISVKLVNTRKLYDGVYKRKCAKCTGYYIKKGCRKNA